MGLGLSGRSLLRVVLMCMTLCTNGGIRAGMPAPKPASCTHYALDQL